MTTPSQLSLLSMIPVETTGHVYYATDMCNIKIGHSRNTKRRGGELGVEMLLVFDGGQLDERRQQRMWKRYRIGVSEWFRAEPELLLWLTQHVEANTRAATVLRQLIFAVMHNGSQAA